jgi:hypothetical protein
MEALVIYHDDETYSVHQNFSVLKKRYRWRTSFRCIFRVKLKGKNKCQRLFLIH